MAEFQSVVDLANLTSRMGFKINGEHQYDRSGISVSAAGDIDGDGFADLIVGSDYASYSPHDDNPSKSYVIFGGPAGFTTPLDLTALDGQNGFQITGAPLLGIYSYSSNAVSSAGDLNGDGFDDILIGDAYAGAAAGSYNAPGASFVVFGHAGGFPPELNVTALNGQNGFRIDGEQAGDLCGKSVGPAGDLNGDGIDDILIGASGADSGGTNSGSSYVVFGSTKGFAANLQLSGLDGANGFEIVGEAINDRSGSAVASAGDFNGDGISDIIIGAEGADANGADSGAAYVVFGRSTGFGASLNLADLNGANGFQISGEAAGDQAGGSVASAGDINADGFDDIVIGARFADPHGSASGAAYVVFGKAGGLPANLQLRSLDGSNGFQISGAAAEDWFGRSAASAGDVNGDGFDDLIIGASLADAKGGDSGAAYVLFGKAGGFPANFQLADLDGSNGFKIVGESFGNFAGRSVASAGDLDGDGFADLIVGATGASPHGGGSGASYVIYGHRALEAVTRVGTTADNAINGGRGADVMRGLAGNDVLIGWEKSDEISGGSGHDRLAGRTGADTLIGGRGGDILLGGFGEDIFDYNLASDSNPDGAGMDEIRDFKVKADHIDLSDLGSFEFVGSAGFTEAGQVRVIQTGMDTLVAINLEGSGVREMAIELIGVDATLLTLDNFIL